MSGSLRKSARSWLAAALMGVLVLVFLLLGVQSGGFKGAVGAASGDAVVSAGTHMVGSRDFQKIFTQQKQHIEQQMQQTLSMEVLVQNGFDQQLLRELARDQAFKELLHKIGINPANSLVDQEIKKLAQERNLPFFDKVTGKFSEQQFVQFLSQQGMTPRQAHADFSDDLAERHFTYAIEAAFRAPRTFAATTAIRGLENRDITFFVLDQHVIPQPVPPTDAQLQAFMKDHAAELTIPELRTVTLVTFSAKAIAPTITPDPAEVQKEFDFKKETLSTPELRTVIQIPVKTAAQGADAAARLAKGEDPAAIAKSLGVEPIVYDGKPQSAIADRKLAAAVFALAPGAVGGPLQGELGLAAVKVLKVTPAQVASFDAERPKIVAGLQAKQAENQQYEESQKFDDARQDGDTLEVAAKKAGVTPVTLGPFSEQGIGLDGKPIPELSPKILKAVFSQTVGSDSDLQDVSAGESFAVRVDKITPPALPALDQKRVELSRAYMMEVFTKALKAKAEALVAEIKGGGSVEAAAAKVNGHVIHQVGLQRIAAQQYQVLGREFLERIFDAKPGDVFAAGAPTGAFIAKLDAVRDSDVTQTARVVEAIRQRVSEDYLKDLEAAAKAAAVPVIKPQSNLALARKTMGIDAAMLAKIGGKPGANPQAGGGPAK